jgi:Mn-containing catalase
MSTFRERHEDPEQRWTTGESPDGEGEFSFGYQPGNDHPDLDEMIDEMYNATS